VTEAKTETERRRKLRREMRELRRRVALLEQELDEPAEPAPALSYRPAEQRRPQEWALLSQLTQVFTATLDLETVIGSVLEEARRLLNVTGTSIWLLEAETQELVCWQSTAARAARWCAAGACSWARGWPAGWPAAGRP